MGQTEMRTGVAVLPAILVVLTNVTPSHVVLVLVVAVAVVVGTSVAGGGVGPDMGGVGGGTELQSLSQQNFAPPGHPGALETSISFVLPEAACTPYRKFAWSIARFSAVARRGGPVLPVRDIAHVMTQAPAVSCHSEMYEWTSALRCGRGALER